MQIEAPGQPHPRVAAGDWTTGPTPRTTPGLTMPRDQVEVSDAARSGLSKSPAHAAREILADDTAGTAGASEDAGDEGTANPRTLNASIKNFGQLVSMIARGIDPFAPATPPAGEVAPDAPDAGVAPEAELDQDGASTATSPANQPADAGATVASAPETSDDGGSTAATTGDALASPAPTGTATDPTAELLDSLEDKDGNDAVA